jgi:hypothetical protein
MTYFKQFATAVLADRPNSLELHESLYHTIPTLAARLAVSIATLFSHRLLTMITAREFFTLNKFTISVLFRWASPLHLLSFRKTLEMLPRPQELRANSGDDFR